MAQFGPPAGPPFGPPGPQPGPHFAAPGVAPYQTVPRIPEDQPFVVMQSAGKRLLVLGAIVAVPFLLIGVVAGVGVGLSSSAAAGFGAVGCSLLFGALIVGLQFAVQWRPGPALAAGPAGVWIRTRPFRSAGIWLPWESIQQVYRRRWVLDTFLCFQTYDPRVGQNLGGLGQLDASMSKGVFGTGLLLNLTSAAKPEAEIRQALAYYANGRVRLG